MKFIHFVGLKVLGPGRSLGTLRRAIHNAAINSNSNNSAWLGVESQELIFVRGAEGRAVRGAEGPIGRPGSR